MVIDKETVCILGLTKAITMDNGKMIEWMEKEFMLIIRSSCKAISKMTIS